MARYLDPRTLEVGDTIVSRDWEGETRFVIEKIEFVPRSERVPSFLRNAAPNRWVEARISGGSKCIVLSGAGSSISNFRPDGTCSVSQTARGPSLEVIKAVK